MNILMIGNKASGKTTYMASSLGLLQKSIKGFSIETGSDTELWFKNLFNAIKSGEYPSPTDKRLEYKFELFYNNTQKVLKFEWLDYNGGVISESDADHLKQDIEKSEGVMLFLEAEALLKNRPSVHKFRRILNLISEHMEICTLPLFSVIIVLTKYDKIPSNVGLNDVIANHIQSFVDTAKNNQKIYVRVVPISCTSSGFYNVELPLLDVLDSGLRLEYARAVNDVQNHIETAKKDYEKSGIIDSFVSWWNDEPTYAELAEAHLEAANEKYEFFKSLEDPIIKLGEYVSNYKIKFPNDEFLIKNTSSNQSSRSRFVEL